MSRKVKVFKYGYEFNMDTNEYIKELRTIAIFHQFGIESTRCGSCSIAIIEFDDGKVESVPLDLIQFADKEDL